MHKTEKSTNRFRRKIVLELIIAILSLMLLISYAVITGSSLFTSD